MLWLLPALPLGIGLLLLAAGRRGDAAAPHVSIATAAASLGLALWAAGARPDATAAWLPGVPLALAFDGLAAAMAVGAALIALAVACYAAGDLGRQDARARCFGFVLVLLGGMMLAAAAASLAVLLIAWEAMALAGYGLVGFWYADRARAGAAARVYLITRAGDFGLFVACGAAFAGAGTLVIADLAGALPEPWLSVAVAGIVLAAVAKSAQFPLGIWTSLAIGGRTHPAALLQAALLVVSGGYLLLRTLPLLEATGWALAVVGWIGVLSALGFGLVALTQRDLKQVLAASTGAQKGLVFLAIGAGTVSGAAGYILAHGMFKALMILSASALFLRARTADLQGIASAAHGLRGTRLMFSLGAVTLAGLPPLSAWIFKEAILAAALGWSWPLFILGMVASAVTTLYAVRILLLVWSSPRLPESPAAEECVPLEAGAPARRAPRRIPLVVGAMALLTAGTVAMTLFGFGEPGRWWRAQLEAPAAPAPAFWEFAVSAAVSAAALVLAVHWWREGRLEPFAPERVSPAAVAVFRRWLGLGGLVEWLGRRGLALARRLAEADARWEGGGLRRSAAAGLAFARGVAAADARFETGGLRAAGAAGVAVAKLSHVADRRVIDGAVAGIADGFGAIGRQARRPQTGLLHQYYAQTVLALGLLALVLWAAGAP